MTDDAHADGGLVRLTALAEALAGGEVDAYLAAVDIEVIAARMANTERVGYPLWAIFRTLREERENDPANASATDARLREAAADWTQVAADARLHDDFFDRWIHDTPDHLRSKRDHITIDGFRFRPAEPGVGPTVIVGVANDMSVACSVTSTIGRFDTGLIPPGASASFAAPSVAGSYDFACSVHNYMTGTLIVDDSDPPFLVPLARWEYPLVTYSVRPRPVYRPDGSDNQPGVDLLTQTASHTVGSDDRSFRIPQIRRYHWQPRAGGVDTDALAALLPAPSYDDTYAWSGEGTHGPYRLDRLGATNFLPVTPSEATAAIQAWSDDHGETPERIAAQLRSLRSEAQECSSCYLLTAGPEARHETAWMFDVVCI